jgi:hypothetical protein
LDKTAGGASSNVTAIVHTSLAHIAYLFLRTVLRVEQR